MCPGGSDIPTDEKKARALIQRLEKDISYISFKNEEEWFQYYGDPDVKPILKDILKHYSETGKYELVQKTFEKMKGKEIEITEEIKRTQEKVIYEKEIEDFYEKNIKAIDPELKLVKDGRQYTTEIGNIDLLTQDKNGRYVVIELKRDQADDDTIGQALRYMGWVHLNLAKHDPVLGMILSQDVTNKLKYSRIGMQHPNIDSVLLLKKHPDPVIKLIQSVKKKFGATEFDYSIK